MHHIGVLDVGETTEALAVESTPDALESMHASLIDTFLAVVGGERDETNPVLDAARLTLAVETALETGGPIRPDSDALRAVERPSAAFVADYEPYY